MPNQARIRRPPRLPSEIHESESAADFTGVAPGDGTGACPVAPADGTGVGM